MLASSPDAVSRYSIRATACRRLSSRDGFSRSLNSRASRLRRNAVFDKYGAPSFGHRRNTAGALGTASSAASSWWRSSAISIAVISGDAGRRPVPRLFGDRFGVDQFSDVGNELRQGLRPLVAMLAVAHRHLPALLLAVPHHEHVRNLLQLGFADLEIDLFAAVVHGGSDAGLFQLAADSLRVFDLAVRDRQNRRLHRSQPDRKHAGVMLHQNTEEALNRTVKRAVHHQRLMRLAVFADVFEPEPAWQREIELHGGQLPRPSNGVHQFDIDFGPVKRRLVRHPLYLDLQPVHRALQRVFGQFPLVRAAVVFAARPAVPGG